MMTAEREEGLECMPAVEEILRVFGRVHAHLGPGFGRDVYRNALVLEFERLGHCFLANLDVEVFYRDEPIGVASADLVVGGVVLVVVEASRFLTADRASQLASLVRATGWSAGLLLNFGTLAEHWLVAQSGITSGSLGGCSTNSGSAR